MHKRIRFMCKKTPRDKQSQGGYWPVAWRAGWATASPLRTSPAPPASPPAQPYQAIGASPLAAQPPSSLSKHSPAA